jgi:hypothetical protein
LPSTGQVGAPDDRLTALAMVPLHLLERPRHRRRFDAAARALVRLFEESHQDEAGDTMIATAAIIPAWEIARS